MTAEEVACTADYARSLTDRIKVAVEGTWHLIVEAYQSRAWSALGYSSWDDYCTREFGTSRIALPREERTSVVTSLRSAGLSLRAIEAATGSSVRTVRRELSGVAGATPDENTVDPAPEPTPVTGIDGKTYQPSRPKPEPIVVDATTGEVIETAQPQRRSTGHRTDVAAVMATVLNRTRDAADAAEKITVQHLAHRSEEAAIWRRSLFEAMQPLQRLLAALEEKSQ